MTTISLPLTSSAGVIPASPSASQAHSAAKEMLGISGQRCIASFENCGHDGSFARTFLGMLLGLDTVLDDLDACGYTATPFRFRLVPSGRLIGGTAYGLLPTPLASDCRGRWGRKDDNLLRNYLPAQFGRIYPHPSLLEVMMGFPTGWTEREHSETRSSRR